MKRSASLFLSIFLFVLLVASFVPGADLAATDNSSIDFFGQVNSDAGEINYRSGAGTEYVAIGMIPNGTILHITDMIYHPSDGFFWGQTSYGGYSDGWVSLRQMKILEGDGYHALDYNVIVSAEGGSINFRSGAGTSYSVYMEIPNGQQLHITDMIYNPNDGFFWGLTTYGGSSGYVSLRQTTIVRSTGAQVEENNESESSELFSLLAGITFSMYKDGYHEFTIYEDHSFVRETPMYSDEIPQTGVLEYSYVTGQLCDLGKIADDVYCLVMENVSGTYSYWYYGPDGNIVTDTNNDMSYYEGQQYYLFLPGADS